LFVGSFLSFRRHVDSPVGGLRPEMETAEDALVLARGRSRWIG